MYLHFLTPILMSPTSCSIPKTACPRANCTGPTASPSLVKNGRYIPEMPHASALFVLARRERIDAVRKFAFDDAPPEDSVDDLNTLAWRGGCIWLMTS